MKKLIGQITKFGVVGILCFLIDYGIYSMLIILPAVHHLAANIVSFTVSLVANYLLSMRFVFARRENLDRRAEFFLFALLSVIGLLISEGIIYLCVDVFYERTAALSERISLRQAKQAAKIVSSAVVMVYNFISRKLFLEKKDKPTGEH